MGKKLSGVVIILAMLAAAPTFAQTTGSVRGGVVDSDGEPLAGVIVEITGEALGDGKRGTVSASNGAFSIPGLAVGTYSLTATLEGFAPQSIDGINVNALLKVNVYPNH